VEKNAFEKLLYEGVIHVPELVKFTKIQTTSPLVGVIGLILTAGYIFTTQVREEVSELERARALEILLNLLSAACTSSELGK
jgi:hypothetical protein